MSRPLKIAIYSGEIPSTTFIERLVTGIANSGAEVVLFGVLHRKPLYDSRVKIIAYKHMRLSKLFHLVRFSILLKLFKAQKKKRLDAYLKTRDSLNLYSKVKYYPVLWHQPDVFHLQWAKGLDDWMWVQDFGMKLVLSLRGAHINYSPVADTALAEMYNKNFPKVDGFHAVSNAMIMEAQKYNALANRIQVVYSGLDLNTLTEIDARMPYDKAILKIISVGRPHWIKGYTYALDACRLLKDVDINFEYTIIGGAESIEYQYQVHDLGLDNEVRLLGPHEFDVVQHMIQESDLLLLPSVKEGIANVVLEAMALGTLVLSTDCGGMNEVITDAVNGFLVPVRDAEAIADAIVRIRKLSPEEQLLIKKNAQDTIKQQHNVEGMVSGMMTLYNEVVGVR
ncbi:colanic acid/amylovoran biosynthesis glycosyltransferase [Gelidibacter sediminis]|uniref:Colanic acid/amylovoran biosynthesis glycosyltransferase n=1 Tax=Gelidibacter sediminis TaxID=1608710 RepID=A0A4R7PJ74_9FLAO|nr:glycosyltransferase family 4 protein [Gelidibacter sediminis]TDU34418.1 colanic acid/amylovoran biosynthesis glycosyltransferase [Gelidibacter sediminis]